MIQPSRGRIALYHPAGHGPDEEPHAAMVVAVHNDRLVNLACFSPEGTYYHRLETQLLQDDDAIPEGGNYAEWMAFQKGQTTASSAVDERVKRLEALLITDGPVHQTLQEVHGRLDLVEAKLAEAAPPLKAPPSQAAPQVQDNASGGATGETDPATLTTAAEPQAQAAPQADTAQQQPQEAQPQVQA